MTAVHLQVTVMIERPHVSSAKRLASSAVAFMQHFVGSFQAKNYTTGVQEDNWLREQPLQVQAVDFSRWLLENAWQEDHVYLQMNAAGAEYLIMEQMVVDGSVLLVDEISIVWHDGAYSFAAPWPDLIEGIVTKLGLRSSGLSHL